MLDVKDPVVPMMDGIEFHYIELKKLKASLTELTEPLESWIAFIRYSGSLSEEDMQELEAKNPALKTARETLDEISMDSDARLAYDRRKSVIYFYEKTMEKRFEDGKLEGKAEGAHQKSLETARAMLREGLSLDLIIKVTGLSLEEASLLQAKPEEGIKR